MIPRATTSQSGDWRAQDRRHVRCAACRQPWAVLHNPVGVFERPNPCPFTRKPTCQIGHEGYPYARTGRRVSLHSTEWRAPLAARVALRPGATSHAGGRDCRASR